MVLECETQEGHGSIRNLWPAEVLILLLMAIRLFMLINVLRLFEFDDKQFFVCNLLPWDCVN